jgi:hypothetical protein
VSQRDLFASDLDETAEKASKPQPSAPTTELRFGRWEDVLSDVTCDALIVDAPYSERTHSGHDGGIGATGRAGKGCINRSTGQVEKGWQRRALTYSAWSPDNVRDFVAHWAPRTRGWFVSITDSELYPAWRDALAVTGRLVFSPLACVEPGSRVRLSGDGPSQWSCWIVVARPRTQEFHAWGTLPGAYVIPPGFKETGGAKKAVVGGKPLHLMQSLVRDYSRAGDLVCDPCAGAGTTLLAARLEGRSAIGAECLADHYAIAEKRLSRPYTPQLFSEGEP